MIHHHLAPLYLWTELHYTHSYCKCTVLYRTVTVPHCIVAYNIYIVFNSNRLWGRSIN